MTAEEGEGAERVRGPQRQRLPRPRRKRLREDEEPVHGAPERHRRRGPERRAEVDPAEEAAEGGAHDEPDPPRRADHPERGRATLRRRHVRDVRGSGGVARGGDPGEDPPDEQPGEGRREGHDDVVEAEADRGEDQDGAAAEAVREGPGQGREEELHQAPDRQEEPEHQGALLPVLRELEDEGGEDGDQDPEPEDVEDDRDEDERHRGPAAAAGSRAEQVRKAQGRCRWKAPLSRLREGVAERGPRVRIRLEGARADSNRTGPCPVRPSPMISRESFEEKETARMEAFSDGVFAFAITLLALNLRDPATSGVSLSQGLIDEWPAFFAFVTSFVSVLIMWMNHHNMFNYIRKIDRRLMLMNDVLLLFVVLTPYTTMLVADHISDADANAAAAVYAGAFLLLSLVWNGLWRYCVAGRRLLGANITDAQAQTITRQYSVAPFSYGAALVIAPFSGLASVAVILAVAGFFAITATISD